MSLKDAILEIPALVEQLKQKFNEAPEPTVVTEQSFLDAKLQDGTIISIEGDEIRPGVPVFVQDEMGNRLPAPDGEHIMEDGSVLSVIGGQIAEYLPAGAAPAEGEAPVEANTEEKGMTPSEAKRMIETIIKETVYSKEEADATINSLKEENEALKVELSKNKELIAETFALVEKIANAPSQESKPKKDGFMVNRTVSSDAPSIEDFRKRNGI